MKVVEKDAAVHGLLEDELKRCREVLASLKVKLDQYPKGALNIRRKRYKDKEYKYYYLVVRKNNQVINRHIPTKEAHELKKRLTERNRIREEILVYRKRIAYLDKLI